MAVATSRPLEAIAAREGELTRWLHAQFRRRLTVEDTRDAIADAITTAHMSRDELDGLDPAQLEAWVRTRAYRNAIDQIRAIDGYGSEKRKASVSVDDYAERLATDDDPWQGLDDELADLTSDSTAERSLALAIERLTPDERRLLRLRHYDGLGVKTIAALLDIHPKKYERLHTRAIGKLRTIFIETTASEHCEPVRGLIARSRREALAPELSAEVAAHVEACEQCRAYEKRSLKLIAALPLPAAPLLDRFWSRIQDFVPAFGGHGDAATAGAGGAASTGILAGLGAKAVAICAGAAATATCVGAVAIPVIKSTNEPAPAKPAATQKTQARAAAKPARTSSVAARPPVVVSPARTTTRRRSTTGATNSSAGSGASLGLESFGVPTPGASRSVAPPPPPPPPASRFSGEFTP